MNASPPARPAVDPDSHGAGLTRAELDPLRYDGQSDHPAEVAGMIHALMPSGVRGLDVGCGTGSVTLIAATARGIDVHIGVLDDAYLAGRDKFDVVMSSDVLEHLPAPAELLRLFVAAARPGGLVILSVPNVAHWSVRWNLLWGRFDYEPVGIMDATHLRWFTESSLRALVESVGLEIVEMRQTAGSDAPPYGRGLWGLIDGRVRTPLVRALTRMLPRLFGVQHVVKARVRA
jgi:predicted TPR repeat methyltransferase